MTTKDNIRKKAKEVAEQCYVVRLRTLNRIVTKYYNDAFAGADLTSGQFNILTAMILLSPTTGVELSALLHMEKSTLSRNLKLMEQNRWIEMEAQGRKILLTVSESGRNTYEATLPHWRFTQEKIRKLMGMQNLEFLNSSLIALKGSFL